MVYRRSNRRRRRAPRRAPSRRYKRKVSRRRPTRSRYRTAIPRALQVRNLNPRTVTMRFQQKEVYFLAEPNLNVPSMISIPMSDLVAPTFPAGTWTPEGNWLFPGFNNYNIIYRHYVVRGAKLRVKCVPQGTSPTTAKNKMYTQIVSSPNDVSTVSSTEDLFEAFNSSERDWYNAGREVGASDSKTYSPAKVWHVPKSAVMGKQDLKCATGAVNAPGAAGDRTFCNITIARNTGTGNDAHDAAVVTVLVDYLVTFMEHSGSTGYGIDANVAMAPNV